MASENGVVQEDGDGENICRVDYKVETVNFYFTNFPNDSNESILRALFVKFGEVVDVYVAKKMNKEGKRFGFARFIKVENASDLESRLNQIWIRKFHLKVNIAKYEKSIFNSNRRSTVNLPSMNGKDCFNSIQIKVDGKVFSFNLPTSLKDHEIVISFKNVKESGKFFKEPTMVNHPINNNLDVYKDGGVRCNVIVEAGQIFPTNLDANADVGVTDGQPVGDPIQQEVDATNQSDELLVSKDICSRNSFVDYTGDGYMKDASIDASIDAVNGETRDKVNDEVREDCSLSKKTFPELVVSQGIQNSNSFTHIKSDPIPVTDSGDSPSVGPHDGNVNIERMDSKDDELLTRETQVYSKIFTHLGHDMEGKEEKLRQILLERRAKERIRRK